MYKKIISTNDNWSSLILRVTLGLVIFPHGAQKLFGWFGGYGFHGTMGFLTGTMGIPTAFAVLAIIAESFGAIGLIVGLTTRVAAFGVGTTIGVAALMAHTQNGFFMNWTGQQAGEGFEFHLLVVGMALALIISGGGKWSLDRMLSK